jgi:hypothetical protein
LITACHRKTYLNLHKISSYLSAQASVSLFSKQILKRYHAKI